MIIENIRNGKIGINLKKDKKIVFYPGKNEVSDSDFKLLNDHKYFNCFIESKILIIDPKKLQDSYKKNKSKPKQKEELSDFSESK
jgi:hypothetical protein